jgi:hypothetical protein
MNKASDEVPPAVMTNAEWIRFQLLNDLPLQSEVAKDTTTYAREGTY